MGDVTMNDDFLKNYKKQPRPEFARSLRLKLLQKGDSQMKLVKPIFRYAFATLLIAVLAVAAIPSARAKAGDVIKIAYIFLSSGPVPVTTDPPVEVDIQGGTIGTTPKFDVQTMSLADAQAQFEAVILLPAWSPNGYVLDKENVEITFVDNKAYQLHMRWSNGESQIELYATVDAQQDEPQTVTQQSGDVIGDVVTGATTSDLLDWMQNGVRYDLMGDISAEEMSKMAASLE